MSQTQEILAMLRTLLAIVLVAGLSCVAWLFNHFPQASAIRLGFAALAVLMAFVLSGGLLIAVFRLLKRLEDKT